MIALLNRTESSHDQFLSMLPTIRKHALIAFRWLDPEARDEMTAEVVANAYCAFVRLVDQGKGDVAYPTPLARYAIRQARSGRKVGASMNVRDVCSLACQRNKGVRLCSLERFDEQSNTWKEIVVEDRRATPAEIAACRIDFEEWLVSLPVKLRRLAQTLARGEATEIVARKFKVSAGRVSQIRRELKHAWEAFQGERRLSFGAA